MDVLSKRPSKVTQRIAEFRSFPLDRMRPTQSALEAAAQTIAAARSPILVAGGGVHLSGACEILSRLQEDGHLPVATTTAGRGAVDDHHSLSVGMIGNVMGRRAMSRHLRPLIDESDVVVLVGTRTNQNGTDSWTLFRRAREIIHIDIDSQEVGRNYDSTRLVGDARATLEGLWEVLLRQNLGIRRAHRPELEATIADARRLHRVEIADVTSSDAAPIRPERVMADVDRLLPDPAILVADASYSSVWVTNCIKSRRPGSRFITPRGLAGLGWGLPMAIGAACAAPGAPVICFVGDGGFAHVWSELETARRIGSRIIVTVFNNGVLGFQKDAENVRFGRHTIACHLAPVDHAKIADACGCLGIRVERAADYARVFETALDSDRPVVIDVVTDPLAFPPITLFDELSGRTVPQTPAHALPWL